MALLDVNQQEEIANLFAQEEGEQEAAEQEGAQPEPDVAQMAEDSSSSEPLEAATEEAQVAEEAEVEDESGHAVPYSRFKKIIEARNEFRTGLDSAQEQIEALESQLAELQNKPKQQSTSSDADDWYNDLFEDENSATENQNAAQYSAIEERLNELEVTKAQLELEAEVSQAEQAFPSVPRSVMLQAVVSNPDVAVMEIAERYSAFITAVQEEAIANYQQTQPQVAAPAAVPEAPPRVGNAPTGRKPTGSGHDSTARNLDDAKNQMFDFLKSNW